MLALAACSSQAPGAGGADDETIACALGGAERFEPVCTVERTRRGDVVTLVVRHPDGGFRRFDVLDGGRGLAVADGANQAVTRYVDDMAEVAIDRDRYRFPVEAQRNAGAEQQAH